MQEPEGIIFIKHTNNDRKQKYGVFDTKQSHVLQNIIHVVTLPLFDCPQCTIEMIR